MSTTSLTTRLTTMVAFLETQLNKNNQMQIRITIIYFNIKLRITIYSDFSFCKPTSYQKMYIQ